jgi:hypothetical protein
MSIKDTQSMPPSPVCYYFRRALVLPGLCCLVVGHWGQWGSRAVGQSGSWVRNVMGYVVGEGVALYAMHKRMRGRAYIQASVQYASNICVRYGI